MKNILLGTLTLLVVLFSSACYVGAGDAIDIESYYDEDFSSSIEYKSQILGHNWYLTALHCDDENRVGDFDAIPFFSFDSVVESNNHLMLGAEVFLFETFSYSGSQRHWLIDNEYDELWLNVYVDANLNNNEFYWFNILELNDKEMKIITTKVDFLDGEEFCTLTLEKR